MKNPVGHRQGRNLNVRTVALIGLTLFYMLSAGIAFASGGGDSGHGAAAGKSAVADKNAAGSHGEEGGHGAASGPKGWVATDTYRVINFAVLAAALIYLLRKPISQALAGRIDGIREQLETLEAKKQEAETQLAQYSEKLSQMDQEAKKILANYIQQGEDTKARLIEQAKLAAEKLEAQAKRNIEHHFQQAKLKLQSELIDKALVKAEAMIKDGISDKDQERLVEEYLDKVVA
jgi:F-type H+-transporting ATPase subunit b